MVPSGYWTLWGKWKKVPSKVFAKANVSFNPRNNMLSVIFPMTDSFKALPSGWFLLPIIDGVQTYGAFSSGAGGNWGSAFASQVIPGKQTIHLAVHASAGTDVAQTYGWIEGGSIVGPDTPETRKTKASTDAFWHKMKFVVGPGDPNPPVTAPEVAAVLPQPTTSPQVAVSPPYKQGRPSPEVTPQIQETGGGGGAAVAAGLGILAVVALVASQAFGGEEG